MLPTPRSFGTRMTLALAAMFCGVWALFSIFLMVCGKPGSIFWWSILIIVAAVGAVGAVIFGRWSWLI